MSARQLRLVDHEEPHAGYSECQALRVARRLPDCQRFSWDIGMRWIVDARTEVIEDGRSVQTALPGFGVGARVRTGEQVIEIPAQAGIGSYAGQAPRRAYPDIYDPATRRALASMAGLKAFGDLEEVADSLEITVLCKQPAIVKSDRLRRQYLAWQRSRRGNDTRGALPFAQEHGYRLVQVLRAIGSKP